MCTPENETTVGNTDVERSMCGNGAVIIISSLL